MAITPTRRKELAKSYGISERTLRRYEDAGVDIENAQAVTDHQQGLSKSATVTDDDKTLRREKLVAETRYKQAQAERAELLLKESKGLLVSIEDVEEALLFIANKVKVQLTRLENELPPQLEGLSANGMQPIIREKRESILEFLAHEFDELAKARDAAENP
jgi:hypothetical protein